MEKKLIALLVTLGVDHGDSADLEEQHHYARLSAGKYPGRVFHGPTFLFDTVGWGTQHCNGARLETRT
jgi:hypothetical protein